MHIMHFLHKALEKMGVKISQLDNATTENLDSLGTPNLEISVYDASLEANTSRAVSRTTLTRRIPIPFTSLGAYDLGFGPPSFTLAEFTAEDVINLARTDPSYANINFLAGDILCVSGTINIHYSISDASNATYFGDIIHFYVSRSEFGLGGTSINQLITGTSPPVPTGRPLPNPSSTSNYFSSNPSIILIDVQLNTLPPNDSPVPIRLIAGLGYDEYFPPTVDNLKFSGYVDLEVTYHNPAVFE